MHTCRGKECALLGNEWAARGRDVRKDDCRIEQYLIGGVAAYVEEVLRSARRQKAQRVIVISCEGKRLGKIMLILNERILRAVRSGRATKTRRWIRNACARTKYPRCEGWGVLEAASQVWGLKAVVTDRDRSGFGQRRDCKQNRE